MGCVCRVILLSNPTIVLRLGWGFDNNPIAVINLYCNAIMILFLKTEMVKFQSTSFCGNLKYSQPIINHKVGKIKACCCVQPCS